MTRPRATGDGGDIGSAAGRPGHRIARCRFPGCRCATTPFHVALPDPLDALSAAEMVLPPYPRMLVLAAPPGLTWRKHGARRLAQRAAGRVLDVDALPSELARALLAEVLAVLDWVAS